MHVLIAAYLVVFAAAGVWSLVSGHRSNPIGEVVGEALAFLVLSAGMLFFLLNTAFPGGNRIWFWAIGLSCSVELLVILSDRKRTIRGAMVTEESKLGTKVALTDLLGLVLFVPAIWVNVLYALR